MPMHLPQQLDHARGPHPQCHRVVDKRIQWAESQLAVPHEAASAGAREQSLAEVLGQGWGCVKLHHWDPAQVEDAGDEGALSVLKLALICILALHR